MGVILSAAADAMPCCSPASGTSMVLNLRMVKGFARAPMRVCRKMAGPGEDKRTAAAMMRNRGQTSGDAAHTTAISKARLRGERDHRLSGISMSACASSIESETTALGCVRALKICLLTSCEAVVKPLCFAGAKAPMILRASCRG